MLHMQTASGRGTGRLAIGPLMRLSWLCAPSFALLMFFILRTSALLAQPVVGVSSAHSSLAVTVRDARRADST